MKKLTLLLVAVAAVCMSAGAQQVKSGVIEVGDYTGATEFYNGSYFDMAPTNFYLAHTGAQMIYTADELADLNGKDNVEITKLTFKFNNAGAFEDITRDVKLYLQETDATAFEVVEGVKQFYTFDNLVLEEELYYEMVNFFGEDQEIEFELDNPFPLAAGKSLLVTIVFDAQDDDNCTTGSDYAPFYTSDIRGKAMTYTDNWTSFVDYAQGNDFPDATSMLGCGTNVDLPVTLITYAYSKATGIDEVTVDKAGDNAYYNLMGQRLVGDNLPAGVYIHNGKKMMVK